MTATNKVRIDVEDEGASKAQLQAELELHQQKAYLQLHEDTALTASRGKPGKGSTDTVM